MITLAAALGVSGHGAELQLGLEQLLDLSVLEEEVSLLAALDGLMLILLVYCLLHLLCGFQARCALPTPPQKLLRICRERLFDGASRAPPSRASNGSRTSAATLSRVPVCGAWFRAPAISPPVA